MMLGRRTMMEVRSEKRGWVGVGGLTRRREGLVAGRPFAGRACRGEGWQAHSVRRESCNSDSSPEPAASFFGGCGSGEDLAG